MRILALDIKAIHKAIDETYGTSRIADGILCNHKRVAESFFSALKGEHTKRKNCATLNQARRFINQHINFYNQKRRHSTLGYISTEQYESLKTKR